MVFNAWIKKWGTDISLKVSKEGKMPINEYLRIRQDYVTKTQALEETITNYQSQNSDLKNRIVNLEDLNVSVSRDNKRFTEFNQVRALNGEWELTTEYQSNKTSNRISFANGSIRIYDDISGKGTFTEYQYTFFAYNYFSKTLLLGLQPSGGKELIHCVMTVKDSDTSIDLTNLDGYFYRMSTVSPTNEYQYTSLKVSMRKLNSMASQN